MPIDFNHKFGRSYHLKLIRKRRIITSHRILSLWNTKYSHVHYSHYVKSYIMYIMSGADTAGGGGVVLGVRTSFFGGTPKNVAHVRPNGPRFSTLQLHEPPFPKYCICP